MTTDLWVILAWSGGLWAIHRGLEREDVTPWFWLGVCVGLGAMAKLSIGLLGLFLVPALLFSAVGRRRLLSPGPWLAGLTALLIMSPMILWNAQNDWVMVRHEQGHVRGGGTPGNFPQWFLGQWLFFSPPLVLLLLLGLKWPREEGRRAVWWISVLALGFFVLKSLVGKVQPNWTAPVYAGPLLLAAPMLARERLWTRLTALVGVLTTVALLAGTLHAQWLGVEAHRHPFKKQHGWKTAVAELAARAPDTDFLLSTHLKSPLNWPITGPLPSFPTSPARPPGA